MKNIMKKMKSLAVAGVVMGIAIGFAPKAQAVIDYTNVPYVSTDCEWETMYNPFAEPTTMAHWMSAMVHHTCWTNYEGGFIVHENGVVRENGFRTHWRCSGTWLIGTNHFDVVNMPDGNMKQAPLLYNNVEDRNFKTYSAVPESDTCLARIQQAAEAKLDGAGTDDAVGANLTIALCKLLRPHEARGPNHDGPHSYVVSNLFRYAKTPYREDPAGLCSGARLDYHSFNRVDPIINFHYTPISRDAATDPNVAPSAFLKAIYDHYGPGIKSCIATLDLVPDNWEGTYLLHNRDYGKQVVQEMTRFYEYDSTTPIMTNRTRVVTHPDAWPALDEDVYLDRGDVLVMKSICYMVDSAFQMMQAYDLPGKKSGKWADNVCTNLTVVQESMHGLGYTHHGQAETNIIYRVGFSERIDQIIHDAYHEIPELLTNIVDNAALALAREEYLKSLECLLDADAFINGKATSVTGKSIVGARNPSQLHLIEFAEAESEDEGGEWNFAGWREFAEKTYASLKGKDTEAAVQTLDLVDLGKKLDIHAGSKGTNELHGLVNFDGIGPNKDGKIKFDMNAFFDGKITRNGVILDGSAITTNGPSRTVMTRWMITPDGAKTVWFNEWLIEQYPEYVKNPTAWMAKYPGVQEYMIKGSGARKHIYLFKDVNRLHLAIGPTTVDSTLCGLYPSNTLFDDLMTMKTRYPAEGETYRSGFAEMTDVYNWARTEVKTATTIPDGVYSAAPTDKEGGAFYVHGAMVESTATLTGTNVTFFGNSAPKGGAIYNYADVVMNGTFTLATAGDTIYSPGTLIWNLANGNRGCLAGYEKLATGDGMMNGNLEIMVDDAIAAPTNIVIATGDFTKTNENITYQFSIADAGGSKANIIIDGEKALLGGRFYRLSTVEDLSVPTTNLVLKVTLPQPIPFTVDAPEHSSVAVYTNAVDEAYLVTGDTVWSELPAYAVYTVNSDKDWYFKGATWVKAITNQLDTLQNPAVDNNEIPDIIEVTCTRAVLEEGQSTNLVAGTTYTAKPAPGKTGGVFFADDNTTLTGTNVTFEGNSADGGGAILNYGVATLTQATFKDNVAQENGGAINNGGVLNLNDVAFENNMAHTGGAIVNGGTVNLLGPVSLKTTNDTFLNFGGLVNWDLTGETTGVLNGYENLINEYLTIKGTLQITVDDYEADTNEFVIATGDFTNIDNKKIFAITNSALGGETIQAEIGGCRVVANGYVYQLTSEEDLGAEPPTTNLVLTAIKFDMSHIIVDSTLPGSLKLGDDIPGRPGFFYGVNCFAEIPHDGTLEDTTTLEIAGGSAAITNEVALKAPAKLILDDGAALSIMGEGSITNSLAAANSISGSGAIYLDKGLTDDQLKNYTDKLAPGSAITVARASVDDKTVKETAKVEEGGKTYYNVITSDQPRSEETDNTVVTSAIVVDGEGGTDGLLLKTNDEKPLIVAGSVTTTVPDQTLKLVKEQSADFTVNGKVSGFETIAVQNKNEAGKMTTTSTLTANKNITISNDGHLEAKALAGGNIDINNTSANTIIGEYSGQFVYVTNTTEGVAQDITLQACGTGMSAIALYGEAGSIYSNVVLVAGVNATPADLSANDGSGMITLMGTNTLSGSVRMKAGSVAGLTPVGVCMRFENADAIISAPISSALSTEIYGACNIASNDDDVATFNGGLTLKDGAVLGGKTRLASSCANDNFVLEGTVTLKDGAEVSRGDSLIEVPSDATLKLQGSKIRVLQGLTIFGTLDVEDGLNDVNKIGSVGTINLKGGELIIDEYLSNASGGGVLNWDLTAGTTTLDWSKVSGSGAWMATVGDVASGTSYTLATNATTVTQTFTVTNSVAGGAAATVNAGGVCKAGGQFWALDVKDGNLTLTAIAPVKLTDVFLIDEEGKTNATAVVKIGGNTFEPEADGSFEVPANYPLDVVYQATDDYMFGPGWKEKTVSLPNGISGDSPMPTELKQQVASQCQECWVDARDVALDTRERIVVGTPEDVLPIAYSTNNWGAVENAQRVRVLWNYDGDTYYAVETTESGYYDWMPELGYYGKYEYSQTWLDNTGTQFGVTNAYIYYSQPYQLTWATPVGGTLAVTNAGASVASGDNVLGYSLLKLAATTTYTNAERYEFTGWTAKTNGVEWAEVFKDPMALTQTFEMPNAAVELAAGFQWKSNYTENVSVTGPGVWEVREGEDYSEGTVSVTNGGTFSSKYAVSVTALTVAAGSTNVWDFTENGQPFFKAAQFYNSGTLEILFDSTLTNGVYTLLTVYPPMGFSGVTSFRITDGTTAKNCSVDGGYVYVGAKRFKIALSTTGMGAAAFILTVESGLPMALTYAQPDGGTITAYTNGAEVVSGEKVLPAMTVKVVATTNLYWQFNGWSGTDATGNPVSFSEATASETTFKMPETNATIAANFIVSEAYKAETAQAITNAANDAIAAVNAMNLSDDEKALYNGQILRDRDAQVVAAVGATVPAGVSGALAAANTAFDATKKAAQAYADQTWTITSVVAYTNIAGVVTVTNESQARLDVEVVATTNLYWQFVNWTGVDAEGNELTFADETSDTTTFEMPETNVTVTANFIVSEAYKAKLLKELDDKYDATTNAIEALRWNRLTDKETDNALSVIKGDYDAAVRDIAGATTPKAAEKAKNSADDLLSALAKNIREFSDAKPYDLIVADNFEEIADEGSYDPETGAFTVNGVAYTNGVNAFTSFRAAYGAADTAFTTNVHVYGTQLIEDKVPNRYPWTLDLHNAILSIGIDKNNNLYASITNTLSAIKGGESILFGKTEDDETRAVKAVLDNVAKASGADITVKAADITPEKKGTGADEVIEAKVNEKAKSEGGITTLPQLVSDLGNINITVEANVSNDTYVAGKVVATNGTVTIVHKPTNQALTVAGEVTAKNVKIDNYGRFDADVTAAEKITIDNYSVHTLVGIYDAKSIEVIGHSEDSANCKCGAISNVTFKADALLLSGMNQLTGPLTNKVGAVTNDSTLAWNVRNGNRAAYLNNLDVIVDGGGYGAYYTVMVDYDQARDTYILADNAASAAKRNLRIELYDGDDMVYVYYGKGDELLDKTWYPGDSRAYTLSVNDDNQLILNVDWGISPEMRADYVASVTNGANAAIAALYEVERLSPGEIAALTAQITATNNATVAYLTDKDETGTYLVNVPADARAAVSSAQVAYKAIVDSAEYVVESIVRFGTNAVETVEGTDFELAVYGGSKDRATAVSLSLVKGSFTKSVKAYMEVDGKLKRYSFPVTLNWEKGDREPKVITIRTAKSSSVDPDKFFTLQLGSEVATKMGVLDICQVTVLDQKLPGGEDYDYVRALPWPANGGKVSGAGYLKKATSKVTLKAKANKWATFAGWYYACTNDATKIDLARGPITDGAKMKVGYNGLVEEAGTYYAYFTNVLAVAAVNEPDAKAEGAEGVWSDQSGVYEGIAGVKFSLPVSITDESDAGKLTISSLPGGLKYNKSTGCIEGVPSRACTKTVKFVAKNAAGKHTVYYTFDIEALPDAAVGTWNGLVRSQDGAGFGSVEFTATSAGKLKAKVMTRATGSKSFSVKGYDYIDKNTLGVAMMLNGGEWFAATLSLTNDWTETQLTGTVGGGKFLKNGEEANFGAIRNAFGKKDGNLAAQELLTACKGTFEGTLSLTNAMEIGAIRVKVQNNGKVTLRSVSQNATYSGTVDGAFRGATTADGTIQGVVQMAVRKSGGSNSRLWTCDVVIDPVAGTVTGTATDYDRDGDDTPLLVGEEAE